MRRQMPAGRALALLVILAGFALGGMAVLVWTAWRAVGG